MTGTAKRPAAGELVPLADRLGYMLIFRVVAALGVAAAVPLAQGHLFASESTIALAIGAYLALAFGAHAVWRMTRRRGSTPTSASDSPSTPATTPMPLPCSPASACVRSNC